jgi:protein-tyrosine phosphatase
MSFWDTLFPKQGIWEIKEGLFVLSKITQPEIVEGAGIKVLVDLEGWIDRGKLTFLTTFRWWMIYDSPTLPEFTELTLIVREAYFWWKAGYQVGVHCKAGRNRASLVVGEVLKMDGMSGVDAVKLIREKRPGALTNETFVKHLEGK